MSYKTNPDVPAFAAASQHGRQEGLTKREYFAAMAMQGWNANKSRQMPEYKDYMRVAEMSVNQADALIEALNGGSDE